jgi:hypothetical protein
MFIETPTFPEIEYNFSMEQLLFESGSILVKYTPVDERLTSITYNIPIWPDMDLNNMKPHVNRWAPFDKWYAQSLILTAGNTILGKP